MYMHTYPACSVVYFEPFSSPEVEVELVAEGDQQARDTHVTIAQQTGWTTLDVFWGEGGRGGGGGERGDNYKGSGGGGRGREEGEGKMRGGKRGDKGRKGKGR